MDVNENLAMIRKLSASITKMYDTDGDPERIAALGASLADHVAALDEWLSRGGFLPSAWQR